MGPYYERTGSFGGPWMHLTKFTLDPSMHPCSYTWTPLVPSRDKLCSVSARIYRPRKLLNIIDVWKNASLMNTPFFLQMANHWDCIFVFINLAWDLPVRCFSSTFIELLVPSNFPWLQFFNQFGGASGEPSLEDPIHHLHNCR